MRPAGFFALRTPLLPLDAFTSWRGSEEELRSQLKDRLADARVREAVFVASPDLAEAVAAWEADPGSENGRRAERALVRYVARMAARPTPFGLFAGCSVGDLATAPGEDGVELRPAGANVRVTRLDMEYVAGLVAALEREPELRTRLNYRPNNSIYRAAGRVRYVEAVVVDRARQHRLVAVDDSPYLQAVLDGASGGARIGELAAKLVDDEVSLEDATAFVEEMVESQLLVSDLEPALTGDDPVPCLAQRLAGLGPEGGLAATAAARLQEVVGMLATLDAAGVNDGAAYRAIATGLEPLPAPVSLPRLFQVDMVKPPARAVLGPRVVAELSRAAELLHDLLPVPSDTPLDRFRDRFRQRYEDRRVPLLEVLDEEVGIGFDASNAPSAEASPLLRDLVFPGTTGNPQLPWTPVAALVTRKLATALRDGADEIEITAGELARVRAASRPPLPNAMAVNAVIAAGSREALAAGDFRVLVQAAVGPSGARMLGRFCHADPALLGHVQAHLRAEAAAEPEAVYAEIVHLPEGRIGNIAMRPAVRDYEIPYLGRGSVDQDHQVPVSDLEVGVQGERVVLWSRRLAREVIPRMTNAHNYGARSVGVYRFLCSLQAQGNHGMLAWDWGTLAAAPYLPRVVSGRLVMSRRRWRLDAEQVKLLQQPNPAARHEALRALAAQVGLPRLFLVGDADNELLTDVENALSAETFVQLIKGRDEAVLYELFPGPQDLWVEGPEGRFTSEVVVPFNKVVEAESPVAVAAGRARARAAHVAYPPGSEWLYLKLYTGTSTADAVLRDLVGPVVREERSRGAVDGWFFIRYGDPDWHLRVRVHGTPEALAGAMLRFSEAARPLLSDGRISRLQVDTYEPELARYGGLGAMPFAERLFEADSDSVLGIVDLLAGDAGMDARWRLAVRGADMIMADLGLDLHARRALMRGLRDAFRAEFRADSRLKGQVGERYRKESPALAMMLQAVDDESSALAPGFALLARRSEQGREASAALAAMAARGELEVGLPDLAASLIHMHLNRLLRSAHRAQELVIYDFLDRYYMSQAERK